MIVLIDDKVYNSNDKPIMVMFTIGELNDIKNSPPNNDIFCSWPVSWEKKDGIKWMRDNEKKLVPNKDQYMSSSIPTPLFEMQQKAVEIQKKPSQVLDYPQKTS